MNRKPGKSRWIALAAALLAVFSTVPCHAFIDGLTGTSFQFITDSGHLSTPDGGDVYFWGFGDGTAGLTATPQYPGPTLIVNEGDEITITLKNRLTEPVSMVFPGMAVTPRSVPQFPAGDRNKLVSLAPEAAANGGVQTYTFRAEKPGTYYYQSGSNQAFQLRMGLFGAIIVRPAQTTAPPVNIAYKGLYDPTLPFDPATPLAPVAQTKAFTKFAYNDSDSSTGYDREFLFLISSMDPAFQHWAEHHRKLGQPFNMAEWKANYWFMNGRNAPDTMGMPLRNQRGGPLVTGDLQLPNQPYDCMPLVHPGETVLLRIINMSQDFHPFHTHGNHMRVVAEDGNLLSSVPANPSTTGADLSWQAFTVTLAPGKTMDATWTWTGERLGWDVYDHNPTDQPAPYESLEDHGKGKSYSPHTTPAATGPTAQIPNQSLPVVFPAFNMTTAGPQWSGSPFMGNAGLLPPGEGGFNAFNGFFYMWHSHSERELTNNNIFPGGFLTMMGVVPWPVPWNPAAPPPDNLNEFDEYAPMAMQPAPM